MVVKEGVAPPTVVLVFSQKEVYLDAFIVVEVHQACVFPAALDHLSVFCFLFFCIF